MQHGTTTQDTRNAKGGATDEAGRTELVPEFAHVRIRKNGSARIEELLCAQVAAAEPFDETDALELMARGLDVPTGTNQGVAEVTDATRAALEEIENVSSATLEALEAAEGGGENKTEVRHERQPEAGPAEKAADAAVGTPQSPIADAARAAMELARRDGANRDGSPASGRRRKNKGTPQRTDGATTTRKRGKRKSNGSKRAA